MKLTESEKQQIQAQRDRVTARRRTVTKARKVLASVHDDDAVELAKQVTNRDRYIEARDKCGCYARTDELCKACDKLAHAWFFGRKF